MLEEEIRRKFANNWTSVRKAFLDVDSDHDGYITAVDIAKVHGGKIDYKDL